MKRAPLLLPSKIQTCSGLRHSRVPLWGPILSNAGLGSLNASHLRQALGQVLGQNERWPLLSREPTQWGEPRAPIQRTGVRFSLSTRSPAPHVFLELICLGELKIHVLTVHQPILVCNKIEKLRISFRNVCGHLFQYLSMFSISFY